MTSNAKQAPAPSSLVMFNVDRRRYAVPLSAVERILPAAHVKPLPGASRKVLGLVSLSGRSVPVLSLRCHLGLRERKIEPSDRLLLVRSRSRTLALVAEEMEGGPKGIRRESREQLPIDDLRDKGLVRIDGDVHLIADVDLLLGADDESRFEKALRQKRRRYRRPQRPLLRSSAHAGSGLGVTGLAVN